MKPKSKTIIVAVIDSGIDINHEDLSGNIWVNTGEIPNNGIDDDNNGYIDDVNGWNFLGGSNNEQLEYVRLLASKEASWQAWVAESFKGGAKGARRFSRAKGVQDAIAATDRAQPFELADATCSDWAAIWATHGCRAPELPTDASEWPSLPMI